MDYDALKTELAKPEYAGLEDAQAAVAVNAKTVDPGRGYVPIADINAWADGIGLTVKVGVMLRKSNADLAARLWRVEHRLDLRGFRRSGIPVVGWDGTESLDVAFSKLPNRMWSA